MPGHFQTQGTNIPNLLMAAYRGQIDLTQQGNMNYLIGCSELAALFKEEQQLSSHKQVSEPLYQLLRFIIEAIYSRAAKKPAFKAVEKEVVQNLKWFPANPIIRKQVLYEIDRKYATQSETQYQHDLNKGSVNTTKYKGPITRLKVMELSKEDEKLECAESDIGCKNNHAATKGVLPGNSQHVGNWFTF